MSLPCGAAKDSVFVRGNSSPDRALVITEKLPLEVYEKRYGPLPASLRIEGCTVVRREFPLTNEADISIELPDGLPAVVPHLQ